MCRFRRVLAGVLVAASVLAATADAREPLVSVEPHRGIPGQLVVVTGRGFCGSPGCGPVRIQLYSAVVSAGVPVSSGGSFVHRIRIPGGAPSGDVGLIATQSLQDGSVLEAFADFEMAVRLRSQQAVKPKQAHAATDGRRHGAVVPDEDRNSEPVPNQTRGDRHQGHLGSPPAKSSGRAQAASAQSDSVDGGGDPARFAAAAVVTLIFGAALALAVVLARGWRPRRGTA